MSYDVNDSTEYPQIVNARNAMGQRKIWLAPIRLGGKTPQLVQSQTGAPSMLEGKLFWSEIAQ